MSKNIFVDEIFYYVLNQYSFASSNLNLIRTDFSLQFSHGLFFFYFTDYEHYFFVSCTKSRILGSCCFKAC